MSIEGNNVYINPKVELLSYMDPYVSQDVWLESRRDILTVIDENTLKIGNEVVNKDEYFSRVLKQGLQNITIPYYFFKITSSNLFRDLVFNFNEIGMWSISQRFRNSIFTEFVRDQYPISSEYEGIKIWEDQFDKYMDAIDESKVTDENRLQAPHSLSCELWVGMNLKELIAFISMLKLKMPFFYNHYGVLFLEEFKSSTGLDLENYLLPYVDNLISKYFRRSEFQESFTRFNDYVILQRPMGLLLLAQFLRQSGTTVKGLWDELAHDNPEEFLNNKLFSAQTPINITYVADEEKFKRTVTNRNCIFSMSNGNDINSWSPIVELINDGLNTTEEFINYLPCKYKKVGEDKFQLCACTYHEDTKFRQEGIETKNDPCPMFVNSIAIAEKRLDYSPTKLNEKYLDLTSKLVRNTIPEAQEYIDKYNTPSV